MADNYEGVVEKVIEDGNHGPYAVAYVTEFGLVTFSLNSPVWKENAWPEGGSIVVLSGITRKRAGWRAGHARFWQLADGQPKTGTAPASERSNRCN
jgi:hypothetical protein